MLLSQPTLSIHSGALTFLEQEQQKERALEMYQGRIFLPREKKSIVLLYFIYTVYASRLIILPLVLSENILVQQPSYFQIKLFPK